MTLPLPLDSLAASQKTDDVLKTIRISFNKAQDFHTAISWLSKQAELIHRDGRPATTIGFHTSAPAIREQAKGPVVKISMPPPAQPWGSHHREKPASRPPSRSGRLPAPQQIGHSQSQLLSVDGHAPAPQYLHRSTSRRQSHGSSHSIAHGVPARRRQSDLRRNVFAHQEADRSAPALPSTDTYVNDDEGLRGLQMPRLGSLPTRVMSAAPRGSKLPPRYSRPVDGALYASLPTALDARPGRHSPHNLRDCSRSAARPESFQETHVPSGQYLPMNDLELKRDATFRLSHPKALGSIPTQHTIAADSMDVDVADPRGNVPDDTARRRRVMSITSEERLAGTPPDQAGSGWLSTTSSQTVCVPTASQKLSLYGPEPPPDLFAVTTTASPGPPEQKMSFEDASTMRESDQCQEEQFGHSRSPSGDTLKQTRGKKRKANQPMKRASRRMVHEHAAGDHTCTKNTEPQTEDAAPSSIAHILEHEPPTVAVRASKDAQKVDGATQTDPRPRLQADLLHISAIMKLDARLLQQTNRWGNVEDLSQGLFTLSSQFVQGLYDICGSN